MKNFKTLLTGGDLRSKGQSEKAVVLVKNQKDFDILIDNLLSAERLVVMRSADAIEKITLNNPQYLKKHKRSLLQLVSHAVNKELKWHLAQLMPRLYLSSEEFKEVWAVLHNWATNKKESRIVRVNSLQALCDMLQQQPAYAPAFNKVLLAVEKENIPSLNARIKQLKNKLMV